MIDITKEPRLCGKYKITNTANGKICIDIVWRINALGEDPVTAVTHFLNKTKDF